MTFYDLTEVFNNSFLLLLFS